MRQGVWVVTDEEPRPEPVEATLTKGPWLTILAPGMVRLRFETLEDVSVPVVVEVDGERTDLFTETRTAEVAWAWGFPGAQTIEDLPGDYTVHDVIIDGVPAGARLDWEVRTTALPKGTALPNPSRDEPLTLVWLADTMFPTSEEVAGMVADMEPDLVLHGGDLQYRSNPADTWNSFFGFLEPVMPQHRFMSASATTSLTLQRRRPSSTTVSSAGKATATRAGMPSHMARCTS